MAEQKLHPALIRIRDKYPASKCLVDEWDKIKKLVQQGKEEEAESLAKHCLDENPRLKIRNKVAVKHRILRREYLKFQRDLELKIKVVFEKLSEKISEMLLNASDPEGKIPLFKLTSILKRLKVYNTEAFNEVKNFITEGVRESIWYGIVISMESTEFGLELHNKISTESDTVMMPTLIPDTILVKEKSARIAKTSRVFSTIFNRVKQRQIKRGLFGGKKGIYTRGTKLSQAIWDLRDENLRKMRNIISSGIAQGKSSTSLATDVKGYTSVGSITADVVLPKGMYRSAYKNALRVTRTETNRAYVDAELEYAKYKGYKKMWNVNVGHREADECDALAGKVFEPDEVPYPLHPNDSCYLTTVIPEG